MFSPLMLPEGLAVAIDIDPVILHIGEEVGTVLRFQDLGDVGVGARVIAVRLVGAIAVIGPSSRSATVFQGSKQENICPGQTYHNPWMVHESVGPETGSVSQNWVCRSAPPG